MSRIPMVQEEQAPPEVTEVYSKIEESGAKLLNLYRVLAHEPNILRNFLRLGGTVACAVSGRHRYPLDKLNAGTHRA